MFSALSEYSEPPEPGVRIWTANLAAFSESEYRELSSFLDRSEQDRATRFHFDDDERHYVLTRGLLRHVLGETIEIAPTAVAFEYSSKGKPALGANCPGGGSLRFNISHSGGWAMFALARDRSVGIDLEGGARLGLEKDLSALAQRILSPREHAAWRALPEANAKRVAFLHAWTRKEAYAKATGEGIFDQLSEIELILDAAAPAKSIALPDWTVHDLTAPEGFAAAVAIGRRSTR